MNEIDHNEKPEVYALHRDDGSWQISRRDFLKAAGIGAAVVSAGLCSGFLQPVSADEESLENICRNAPAHDKDIQGICTSADGKYLISWSRTNSGTKFKCWDFENYVLVGTHSHSRPASNSAPGFIKKKSAVTYCFDSQRDNIYYMDLPALSAGTIRSVSLKGNKTALTAVTAAKNGNIYAATDGKLLIARAKTGTDKYEKAVTLDIGKKITKCAAFDGGKKLFASFGSEGCGIVDTEDGSVSDPFPFCRDFAVLPGETAVLLAAEEEGGSSHLCLYSLTGGGLIWDCFGEHDYHKTAVTPDGAIAVLTTDLTVELRELADGSFLAEENFNNQFSFTSDIAVSGDGTKIACCYGNSILFISLPDLKLIGCPLDIKEMKDNKKGVEVIGKDVLTGKEVHYTLPCGAAVPSGAVCTCNCVAGRGGCAVNCSCNGHSSSKSYGSSYWYPN